MQNIKTSLFHNAIIYQLRRIPLLWLAAIPLGNSVRSIFMVATLISLCFTRNLSHSLKTIIKTPWFYALSAAILWSYFSFSWAPGIEPQTGFYLKKISELWLFPFFILGFTQNQQKDDALNLFLVAMLIPFILGLLKYYGISNWHHVPDPGLLFYNHIITGFYAAFAAFLALELFFKEKKIYYLLAWLAFSFQVLFINTGRAAYGIYFIFMLYSLWPKTEWKTRAFILITSLLCLVFIIKMSHSVQNNILAIMHELDAFKHHNFDTSLGFRMQFHHFAYTLWKQHWLLGGGLGSYDHEFIALNPVPAWPYQPNTHSQYWFFACDFGLIGLGLWVGFLISLAKKAKSFQSWYGHVFNGFLLAYSINLFSDNMMFASPVYLLMGLWAIAYPKSD